MAKFSTEEVQARIAELSTQYVPISRLSYSDPKEVVDSIKELIGKALNSDPDSIYHLILLYCQAHSAVCAKALLDIAIIERLAPAAQLENPVAVDNLKSILGVISELETATDNKRSALLVKLTNLVNVLVNSSKTSTGVTTVKVPSTTAVTLASEAVNRLNTHANQLVSAAEKVINAEKTLLDSSILKSGHFRQARRSLFLLQDQLDISQRDMSNVILDLVVSKSLLSRQSTLYDPRSNKVTTAVTTNNGLPARINGGNRFPAALPVSSFPAGATVNITVDGSFIGTITAPVSFPPLIDVYVPPALFQATETGSSQEGDGAAVVITEYLKTYVEANSVVVTTVDNTNTTVIGTDVPGAPPNGTIVGAGIAAGTINYATGVCVVTYTNPPRLYDPISWTYGYHAIGDLEHRNATGASVGDFADLDVIKQHVVETNTLSQAVPLTSLGALATEIDTQFAGSDIYCVAVAPDVLRFTSDQGGTQARMCFPGYTVNPQVNEAFGAPTWPAGAIKLNDVLGAVYSRYDESLGTDTQLEDLVYDAALIDRVTLSPHARTVVYNGGTFTVITAEKNKVTVPTGIGALIPSSNVWLEVRTPLNLRVGILSVLGDVITLEEEIPFPITTGTTFAATVDITYDIISGETKMVSASEASTSKITVDVAGLGFSTGDYYGYSTSVTLANPISEGFTLKPNDLVYEGDTEIAVVKSVNGLDVEVELTAFHSFYPGLIFTTLTYPYGTLVFKSVGAQRLKEMLGPLSLATVSTANALAGFVTAMQVYIQSGVGHAEYTTKIASMRSAVTTLKGVYDGYSPNKVRVVEHLFEILEVERLTRVVALLKGLDFASLEFTEPEEMSEPVSVESLLLQVSAELSGGVEYVDVKEGDSLMSDYTERPHESLRERDVPEIE